MQEYTGILQRCPLFAGIAEKDISSMLGCLGARMAVYGRMETVFAEGDIVHEIGVVLSGAVQIVRMDYYGNRSITAKIGILGLFGEAFACAGTDQIPVTVEACAEARVLFVDSRRLMQPCENGCAFHQQLERNLLRVMADKNLMLQQKLEILSKRSTREKLLTYLQMQAKRFGSSFDIPYDRQGLADYLGVDRSGLSAEIGKLCKEGIIRCRRSHFELL